MSNMSHYESISYYFPELVMSLKQTLLMVSIAMGIGGGLGLLIGTQLFLSQMNQKKSSSVSYIILNSYVNVIRSFPFLLLVVALIPMTRWLVGTGFGPVAASVSLSVVSIAIYARLVEQVLLDIPVGVLELADCLGVSSWQFVYHFLWLEARSGLVLSLTSMLISLVSYSTVMGVVGGGGIGDFAIRYGYQRYETAVMYTAVTIMILIVGLIQFIGSFIAKKIDKRMDR